MNESGSKLMDKDVKDISEVDYKETGHPLGVLTKMKWCERHWHRFTSKINKNVIDVEVEQYNKREKMAEMHSLNFENLIANFIKIYLNPRCDLSNLNIISKMDI